MPQIQTAHRRTSIRGLGLGVLLLLAAPAEAHRVVDSTSWGDAATHGGRLVELEVVAPGAVRVLRDLCRPGVSTQSPSLAVRWQIEGPPPSAGSRLVGIVHEGAPIEVHVPDAGWTRWALELVPGYLAAVCEVLGGADADPRLRRAWGELLAHPDPRARDEASRLAASFPGWVTDMREGEAVGILGALAGAPVSPTETLRWVGFLLRLPPGDVLLAVLRTAESSTRPVFLQYLAAFRALRGPDPAIAAWCRALPTAARPASCPPISAP